MGEFQVQQVVQVPHEMFVRLVETIESLRGKVEWLENQVGFVKSNQLDGFLTLKESMSYLCMKSSTTFRKYVDLGLIPIAGYNGQKPLFLKSDLEKFVSNRK
jgi:hypothetical protein